jgi:hypothetical protein
MKARYSEAVFLVRLGTSWERARSQFLMLFPYTSFPAGNELILKLTKNTASVSSGRETSETAVFEKGL